MCPTTTTTKNVPPPSDDVRTESSVCRNDKHDIIDPNRMTDGSSFAADWNPFRPKDMPPLIHMFALVGPYATACGPKHVVMYLLDVADSSANTSDANSDNSYILAGEYTK